MQRAYGGPLIAHIIYRLDVGGLENGLVNLINHLPPGEFRHAIICLTGYTDFRNRITAPGVQLHALLKRPGNSPLMHVNLWKLLRRLRPSLVHTRNLAALECQVTAAAARVPVRIHSEHGRDVDDLDGRNPIHLGIRRGMRPFVHQYIALSRDLERYLQDLVHVKRERLNRIYNGVDTRRFHPAQGRLALPHPMFRDPQAIVVGTVGRMEPVKDPLNLVHAVVQMAGIAPDVRHRLRLVMVGDGALRREVARVLEGAGLSGQAWLPGTMGGIEDILHGLDIFVLPSLSEGVSNTVLEAMASGLPIVATGTGGNPELLDDGITGTLVPPADSAALSAAILRYARQPALRREHGHKARQAALERFSLSVAVARYREIYRDLLERRCPHVLSRYGNQLNA